LFFHFLPFFYFSLFKNNNKLALKVNLYYGNLWAILGGATL
jgi:hypothetical protein